MPLDDVYLRKLAARRDLRRRLRKAKGAADREPRREAAPVAHRIEERVVCRPIRNERVRVRLDGRYRGCLDGRRLSTSWWARV